MKKIKIIFVSLVLLIVGTFTVFSDDYDFSDREYWDDYCENYRLSEIGSEQYTACSLYQSYKLESSANRIDELTNLAAELEDNLEEAQRQMEYYNSQIAGVEEDINNLQIEIDSLQADIDALQARIDINEAEVTVLNTRVLGRMSASQSTMHFNTFLEFLLGASSFEELLRRSYGLETIMQSDEDLRNELQDVLDELNSDRAILDDSMDLLETQQAAQISYRQQLDELIAYQQMVYDETNAEIEATYASLEEEIQNYADLVSAADLAGLPNDEGFISPIPGASISAGTWRYPASFGGSIHLGVDFAVGLGTQIYAPATGVVLITSDGCPYGYLGDRCGSEDGGEVYGGNQVYLMVSAGGSIYGVIFCHLLAGSILVEESDVVVQGQAIAQVGSSGNSTGPHSHVELFYLGEGNLVDIPDYLSNNYTKSFNCGWGSAALNRLCENGVGAPCRLRPEEYFSE